MLCTRLYNYLIKGPKFRKVGCNTSTWPLTHQNTQCYFDNDRHHSLVPAQMCFAKPQHVYKYKIDELYSQYQSHI